MIGTPIDLGAVLKMNKPAQRVKYELGQAAVNALRTEIVKAV